jgi:hypothetical protein
MGLKSEPDALDETTAYEFEEGRSDGALGEGAESQRLQAAQRRHAPFPVAFDVIQHGWRRVSSDDEGDGNREEGGDGTRDDFEFFLQLSVAHAGQRVRNLHVT